MAKRILIVDDEPLIVKGLKYSLEQDGYETDSAADGEEAINKFFAGQYDFTGKTIIPFATSGSSGIGSSGENIAAIAKGAKVVPGERFKASASADELRSWASRWL